MDHPKVNKVTLNGVTIGVDEKGKVIPDNKSIEVETGSQDMAIPVQDNIILENGQIIGKNGEIYITIAPDAVKALFKKSQEKINEATLKNGNVVLGNGEEIVVLHPELLRVVSEGKKKSRNTKIVAQGRDE